MHRSIAVAEKEEREPTPVRFKDLRVRISRRWLLKERSEVVKV